MKGAFFFLFLKFNIVLQFLLVLLIMVCSFIVVVVIVDGICYVGLSIFCIFALFEEFVCLFNCIVDWLLPGITTFFVKIIFLDFDNRWRKRTQLYFNLLKSFPLRLKSSLLRSLLQHLKIIMPNFIVFFWVQKLYWYFLFVVFRYVNNIFDVFLSVRCC